MRTLVLLAALLVAAPFPASARDVAGVTVPDAVTAAGKPLVLNGAGLRRRVIVDVYVGALYLPARTSDADAILARDEPWHVRLSFLRSVGQDDIMGAFREGFRKNSPEQAAELEQQLARIAPAIGKVKRGSELTFTYEPGEGTAIQGPGGVVAIEGKPLADALLRNWIGPRPADSDLKKGMLGR